jgi:hypothetical protein
LGPRLAQGIQDGNGLDFSERRKGLVAAEMGGFTENGSVAAVQAKTTGAELKDEMIGAQRLIRYSRPGGAPALSYSSPSMGSSIPSSMDNHYQNRNSKFRNLQATMS